MRRWLFPLAAIGFVHAASADEPDYRVTQSPAQEWYLRGSKGNEQSYRVDQSPVQSQYVPLDRGPVAGSAALAVPPGRRDPAPLVAPTPLVAYDWTGFYTGVNVGGAGGSYAPITSTGPGTYFGPTTVFSSAVNGIGGQSIKPTGFIGGQQFGYNRQFGSFVAGLEGDFSFLHLNGSATGAGLYPGLGGNQFVVSSYAHSDWLFTLRPRLGWGSDNWLFYVTGGLALTNVRGDFLFTDSFGALQSAAIDSTRTGYAVGGGVEVGLTERLRLKAEYLHVDFDRAVAGETSSNIVPQGFSQSAALNGDILRVGLNYRLGGPDAWLPGGVTPLPLKAPPWPVPAPVKSEWEFEAGTRTWFSTGSVGAPQPLLNAPPTTLASRLTYGSLDAYSGEAFGRADLANGWFLKGFLGAGAITGGKLNDEDFPGFNAYSNTLSATSGHLGYANVDIGYSFLRAPGARLGAFVGYNYYAQQVNAYGCTQLAGDTGVCTPGAIAPGFLGIAESDRLNSLRIGLSSQYQLTERLRFTADAAYLPFVNFAGQDDHDARELLLPEKSSLGDGVMLEAILGYDINPHWNVGVGARYWAWSMRNGAETFDFIGIPPVAVEPARFNAERYGAFVQTSYRWGDATPLGTAGPLPVKAPVVSMVPMNWTGIYVGGHMGGGWSNDNWSDPFGSSASGLGATDVAGFGDTTHGTGPLGGGQVGANWQTGHWVVGVEGDFSAMDLRGENTCFSGLGGVNCQHIVNALSTVAGRVGFAWDRSLIYAKAGGAWADTSYNVFANTNGVTLGSGSANVTAAGWVAGAGLEYAFTRNWTTVFEYEHADLGTTTVTFPTVAVINTQNIGIKQSIDIFKLGANYKFDWLGPLAMK